MKRFLDMLVNGSFPLIMSLPDNRPKLAQAAWDNGADAVKIHINVKHHASATRFYGFDEEEEAIRTMLEQAHGPMGIVLGGDIVSASRDFNKVLSSGLDFISLYGHHMPVEVIENKRMHKMLAPDYTWQDWEIAGLGGIGGDILEASVMRPESYGQPLSARELIRYRHLAQICDLPMVVPTQCAVKPGEVEALCRCGVKGLMIGAVVTGKDADSIAGAVARFRKAIDGIKR